MRRFIGKGEREKTIKYRFFDAKEPKQGAQGARVPSDTGRLCDASGGIALQISPSPQKQDIPNGMPCFFTVEDFKLSMRRYIGRGERRSKAPYLKSISRPEAEKNIEAEQSSVVQINLPL